MNINTTALWNKTLEDLELTLAPADFKGWFHQTHIAKIEGDKNSTISISTPTSFAATRLKTKYEPLIRERLEKFLGKEVVLVFVTENKEGAEALGPLFEPPKVVRDQQSSSGLYKEYTFDNFVVGQNNNFAYQVALSVAQEPGSYNPFFLHSGVGLGKTHLTHAIGNYVVANYANKKVLYTTSEMFMNDLLKAISERSQHSFRMRYRNVDVLLIDDIQFIAGRESTQEEFFNTFNALHMAKKQIVITSDRTPREIAKLEERMSSRFAQGMMTDMQAPDTDTRIAILKQKQQKYGHELAPDVIEFLAQAVRTNIRELEGALRQLIMFEKTMKEEVTVEIAKEKLTINSSMSDEAFIGPAEIMKAVCDFFAVNIKDLKGPRRQRHFVVPRQITMYLMKNMTHLPYMSIGDLLGGRDHTTIMHGVGCIETQLSDDPRLQQQLDGIKERLGQVR